MIAAILMFALVQLIRGEEVFKMIGSKDCKITLTVFRLDIMANSVVTNHTKLETLFVDQYVYSNATMSTSGDCTGLHVYDHALGEKATPVLPVLQVKNTYRCYEKERERHYMFNIWDDTHIVQEWNLFYICPPRS